MRRQRARTLAQISVSTGLPPSEVRSMTALEIGAYIEVLTEIRNG